MSTIVMPEAEALKYPIGPFKQKADPSAADIAGWLEVLVALPAEMRRAVAGLNDSQLDTQYRPQGWTVRQVVHHVPDSHMNAALRTCWTLTEEKPTIKPYDQAAWADLPYARTAPVAASLDLLEALHTRWIAQLRALTPEQWQRQYYHPEDQRSFTLLEMLQLYAWHSRHHVAHITSLRQRNGWD